MVETKRRTKYYVACSLDGYISRPDGGVDWLFTDQDYGMAEFFRSVDIAVMGRRTWEKVEDLAPGRRFGPDIDCFVFSRTMPEGVSKGVHFVSGDVGEWLWTIRQQEGKDIWIVGGGDMVRSFLDQKLVDEIILSIHPCLLGDGVRLFAERYPQSELELTACRPYSTGMIQLFYSIKR
jgi:dihydrofolate reductase